MNQQSIRLGAEVRVCNATHSMHQHLGRYMGPAELPSLENRHRVCFDGKVHLLSKDDFELLYPEKDMRDD